MIGEHGTPQGYKGGCRGPNCAHHGTKLMTCTEASIRYAGDYAYRKQVDAGTATAEKEVFAKPVKVAPVKVVKPPRVKATPKPKTVKVPREPKPPKPVVVRTHGDTYAGRRACKTGCPNEETCTQKRTRLQRLVMDRIKAREIPAHLHGTKTGYSYGCKKGSPCPGDSDGRTCSQAANDYKRDAYRKSVEGA